MGGKPVDLCYGHTVVSWAGMKTTSSPSYTTVSCVVGGDERHMGSPMHRVCACSAAGYSGTVPQFPPLEMSMTVRPFH